MTRLIGQHLGRYLVQEEIGRGGMARVYRAFDTLLKRTVALKVMAPHLALDPEFERRFEREAITVANLRHPNIVTVYDIGEANGLRYIAMEYVRGRTVHAIIRERGALGLAVAISIIAPVADALDHAHAQGAVHRDVKPHNILIDIEGRVLLTDFGIAQAPDGERLTRTGIFMGTPEYISPEQASAQRVDGRSDLYSLAITTYEMITGVVPFSGATPQLIMAHMQSPPPPPSSVAPQEPPELDLVLARALAKRPEQRFGSGAAFVEALRIVARRNNVAPASQQEIADLALPRAVSQRAAPSSAIVNGPAVRPVSGDADRVVSLRGDQTPMGASPRYPLPGSASEHGAGSEASLRPPLAQRRGIRRSIVVPISAGIVVVALIAALFGTGVFGTFGQTQPALPPVTVMLTETPPLPPTWTPAPSPTSTPTPLPTATPTPEPPTPLPPTQAPVFVPPPPPPPPPPTDTPEPPTATPTDTPEPPTATPTEATPSATATPETTPTATVPTETATPTVTPDVTITPSPAATTTLPPDITPTVTFTPTTGITPTATVGPANTETPSADVTASPTPSSTSEASPTVPSPTPVESPTASPTPA
ncbi:MAG: protein kinase domain-containing protein [Roseiflexus sp.]